jgi:hypothetical protein
MQIRPSGPSLHSHHQHTATLDLQPRTLFRAHHSALCNSHYSHSGTVSFTLTFLL